MCLECDGWTHEEVLDKIRDDIGEWGWSVVAVEGDGGEPPFAYTVGLTRFHGHPELLVSGLDQRPAAVLLNGLADEVAAGRRFAAGEVLPRVPERHACLMVRVTSPGRLVVAQEVYGTRGLPAVPALQAAWADCSGAWPWQTWDGRRRQRLYGRPRPAAA